LKNTDSPRIILVGGSNLSFGINSAKLKESLNINVINTAVHAGLGLKFIVEDITNYLKTNDIVILSPEYAQFFGNDLYGMDPMISTIISVPDTYSLINFQNWKEILGTLPKNAIKNILKFGISEYRHLFKIEKIGIYDRNSFNGLGDVVTHYDLQNEDFIVPKGINKNYNEETMKTILLFKKAIDEKDGLLIFTYPCLIESSFVTITDQVELINDSLKNTDIEILGNPKEYSLNDSLFFNSHYHLNKKGIDIRTDLLIQGLKQNAIFQTFLEKIK